MALTYGFFNSSNHDRVYSADQMSEYFKGLVSDGVYENVGGALQVIAGGEMEVQVRSGRMIIGCKWLNNDSIVTLEVSPAHPSLNRYTAVIARLDRTNRIIEITTKDGAAAADPLYPALVDDGMITEKCLAYIYVGKGVTSLSQAVITDVRADTAVCGWVTGLIEQVDTSELFLQWQTAYEEQYARFTQMFEEWFRTLTDELGINTYLQQYQKTVTGTAISQVDLDMEGYTYSADDVIRVLLNGLEAVEGTDYLIDAEAAAVVLPWTEGEIEQSVEVKILKSVIGQRPAG